MKTHRNPIGFRLRVAGAMIVLALSGCARTTAIRDLAKDSRDYRNKDVRIHGRVVSSFSFPPVVRRGFYVVSDGTGQIGVLSPLDVPKTNSEVTVSGRVADVPAIGLPAVKQFKIAGVMIEEKERSANGR